MASIRFRTHKWQCRIQRKGYPTLSKAFETKEDAQRWARGIERSMDLGEYAVADTTVTTLGDLIDRYLKEVTPTKRGATGEKYRLGVVKMDKIASLNIKTITSADVAGFRDRRLAKVKSTTARHDLFTISAVFEHARLEWSYAITNPVRGIRIADHIANRIVSHSPTEKRKGDVVKATAVLEQDKKALQYKNAELDQHNRKISAEHDALNNKHLKLAAEHDELSVKHKKTLQLQETQATAAKKASANIAPRVIRTATRAASTLPAKVVPLAGTAITVGMTLWDINDMCETLKDINELNAAYGHAKIDQETVCGIKVPGT